MGRNSNSRGVITLACSFGHSRGGRKVTTMQRGLLGMLLLLIELLQLLLLVPVDASLCIAQRLRCRMQSCFQVCYVSVQVHRRSIICRSR